MAARKLTVSHINPASAFRVVSLMALAGFVAWMIGAAMTITGMPAALRRAIASRRFCGCGARGSIRRARS